MLAAGGQVFVDVHVNLFTVQSVNSQRNGSSRVPLAVIHSLQNWFRPGKYRIVRWSRVGCLLVLVGTCLRHLGLQHGILERKLRSLMFEKLGFTWKIPILDLMGLLDSVWTVVGFKLGREIFYFILGLRTS